MWLAKVGPLPNLTQSSSGRSRTVFSVKMNVWLHEGCALPAQLNNLFIKWAIEEGYSGGDVPVSPNRPSWIVQCLGNIELPVLGAPEPVTILHYRLLSHCNDMVAFGCGDAVHITILKMSSPYDMLTCGCWECRKHNRSLTNPEV